MAPVELKLGLNLAGTVPFRHQHFSWKKIRDAERAPCGVAGRQRGKDSSNEQGRSEPLQRLAIILAVGVAICTTDCSGSQN